MPKGGETEEKKESAPEKGGLQVCPFQLIFPLFSSLRLHFGKNVLFYSVSRIFCRGLVAQSVEHRPFKAGVQGSSPCQLTFFVPSFPGIFHLQSEVDGPPFSPPVFKNEKGFAHKMQTREDQKWWWGMDSNHRRHGR